MTNAGVALIDPRAVFEKINLSKGMRVADLGCGRTGHFVFSASRIVGDTGVVYAVDVIKDILESLKSRVRSEGFDNVQPIWSDIEILDKTPIPSSSLDICFFVNVMFLLGDKVSALKESTRMLKPGGLITVIDWAKKLGPLGPGPELMTTPEDIINLAKKLGLTLLNNFSLGGYHYCLIFKKC
ncbi:MAG: methyltransferase domain-containing protein [Candidatus Magasanikbacteria bacterium]